MMNKQINDILEENLQDEVNVNEEWERLYNTILQKSAIHSDYNNKRNLLSRLLSIVAALLVGVFLTTIFFQYNEENHPLLGNSYKITTGKGEKSMLQLPDGSKVWLNACTTLEYPADYGINNRDIRLAGEAYFEVAKNRDIPFIVTSNELEVTALGTAFNVCAYENDDRLTTALFSGQIMIEPISTKQQILLNPDQIAVYYKEKNKIETMPYQKQMFAEWRKGGLSFEMMYLEEITKSLERNYDVVFQFKNQRIKRLRFSGYFSNNESLTDILKVIKINTSISYQVVKDTVVVE